MDGQGGGSSHPPPFLNRAGAKRNFDTMAASHQAASPVDLDLDLPPPYDYHYANGQPLRRRRLGHGLGEPSSASPRGLGVARYEGDGLDLRRPVMSDFTAPRRHHDEENSGPSTQNNFIDLTDEDATQESHESEDAAPAVTAATSSHRAQRLPRYTRDDLFLDDSLDPEASDLDISRMPGASFLALPGRSRSLRRPQFSSLRRPARSPSPPADMDENEVEFVRERPIRTHASRHPTPQLPPPPRYAPRSVTPYPTGAADNVVDLTAEDDDDIVLVNARQREGNNREGAPNVANPVVPPARDYTNLAYFTNILREGGANLGGRLMQRIQGFGIDAIDAEIRALDQAMDHFEHNHLPRHRNPPERRELHRAPQPPARAPLRGIGLLPVLDVTATGFDLGLPGGGNRQPTPKYEPPTPPGKGFTRSPEENEVVVCPNCGDELAVGVGEVKQEIWAIKTCGHVYCGECAHLRAPKSRASKKGKGRAAALSPEVGLTGPMPFKNCVVESCGKPASRNSMIRVYLGT